MPLHSARLSKQNRLLSAAEFKSVLKHGGKCADPLMSVYVRRNQLAQGRLGIAVSRRVSGKAVVRNRIRRQVRESFRLNKKHLEGLDIVVVARATSATRASRELRGSLGRHWERVRQRCRNFC